MRILALTIIALGAIITNSEPQTARLLTGRSSSAMNSLLTEADYSIRPVPFTQVEITDEFWAPKMEVNRAVSIPYVFKKSEENGGTGNPRVIEAAAYTLAKRRDPALEQYVDQQIDKLVAGMEARGSDPDRAIRVSGHFLEAAAVYFEVTGKRKMLDAAIKATNLIASAYGPGKKTYISGHEGQKIGLLRLYRATGDETYLKLAKFFLDERGKDDYPRRGEYALDRTYAQDHEPVIEQDECVGHCVRAMFLYIPTTDIAALTARAEYGQAVDKIWEDMVRRKIYLTGSIGSIRFHEQFGAPYELPNLSAWNETCASYGSVVWNHRMFLFHQDAKYLDVLERVLYNGFLAGVSLKGDRFFYQNPLKSFGHYERFAWINVPCCPPNVVRLMASLGDYIYAQGQDAVYVNLFVGSRAEIALAGNKVKLKQETRYPWEGTVKITVDPERAGKFALNLRIPGWAQNQPMPSDLYQYLGKAAGSASMKLNGKPIKLEMAKGFARISNDWKKGDVIELTLPMPVRRVLANPQVKDDEGRVALERGPLVYCAEWPDNGGQALNLFLPDDASLKSEFRQNLLGGVNVVTGKVQALGRGANGVSIESKPHQLTAIPYYAWANRGMGEMEVWLARRRDKARATPVPPEPVSRVTSSGGVEKVWTGYNDQNDNICAVYDGVDPLHSADESSLYFRMRPAAGTPAWVEYEFKRPTKVSFSEVYWVDDRRFCKLPSGWRIVYKDGHEWKPVVNRQPYGVEKNTFNRVSFDPVMTTALRLEVEPKKVLYKSGEIGPPEALFLQRDIEWREIGIIEWRVK